MGRILKIEDFAEGDLRIPVNPIQENSLNELIKTVEDGYLNRLLGVELCALFFVDLDLNGVPQNPLYQEIFNPFFKDVCGYFCDSLGMKVMLKNFVYFYWTRGLETKLSTVDVSVSISENSINSSLIKSNIVNNYNIGVDVFTTIRFYLQKNKEDYPEFNGIEISNCGLI
jgi:hypothetical protein